MRSVFNRSNLYLVFVILFGTLFFIFNLINESDAILENSGLLFVLCVLASIALIFNVYGFTQHTHYNISFLVYSFAIFHFGLASAGIVILVSHLVEWPFGKYKWHVQVFNIGQYLISVQVIGLLFIFLNKTLPLFLPISYSTTISILFSLVLFVLMNHLLVGLVIWFFSGESFKDSGVMNVFTLTLDYTFLILGMISAILWKVNILLSVLPLIPVYLMYSTLRVPALERASELDQKTGLFNATYFITAMQTELPRAKRFQHPLTIVMADLDLLRNINNTYGHLAGDLVLVEVAQILKDAHREYDVVARFGGEEFSIMMPEISPEAAFERIEKVRQQVENYEFIFQNHKDPIHISLSFGIASAQVRDQSVLDFIHQADIALYLAKLSGRNRTILFGGDDYKEMMNYYSLEDTIPQFLNVEDRIGKLLHSPPKAPREK
jgi:diguanylate cyclase (GGDEF)-like protein